MNILTGNVTIKRIWQLLKKTVTSADLANYSVAIDSKSDSDTKRIPLDELRTALMNSGLFDYRGDYDASVNLYPASGGSGTGGAILKANAWIVSVGGTIDGNVVIPGQILMAKVDNPGQTSANWFISLAGKLWDTYDFAISDEATAIATGTAKFTDHWPFDFEAFGVFVGLSAVSTSGNVTIDVNDKDGNTIFSTRPTVLVNEFTSLTNGTQPVLSTTIFAKGDKFTVDIDLAGTGAKGVKIHFKGIKS
jgi:hypothetical protein